MTTDAANAVEEIHRLLRPGVKLRAAAPGILSALPLDAPSHPYDAKAAIYDLVVARRLYNRILWGANRDDYSAFERLAVDAPRRGWMLDAGCGSLVFTHRIYARHRLCWSIDRWACCCVRGSDCAVRKQTRAWFFYKRI